MKGVVVLGSTGSIGTQTLDVISQFPDRLRVVGLAAHANEALLTQQADRFAVPRTCLTSRDGNEASIKMAMLPEADVVVVAVAGVIGLLPTLAAISKGKHIALASKEVLVAAGEMVMPFVRKKGAMLTPIDSEHSAIFQCLQGYRSDQVDRLILTASGGPFRGRSRDELGQVTVEQALNHPTWRMGGKITVDSATLMNKALEMIEARWLFDVDIDRVDVVVHPQSIVHSMVKFRDGSVLGQMGWPDMRLPIAYALLYPERPANGLKPWNPVDSPKLTFETVDEATFPALSLARRAVKQGGTMPCVFNAANEFATNEFLRGSLTFLAIADVVSRTMEAHIPEDPNLPNVLRADAFAREFARSLILSL